MQQLLLDLLPAHPPSLDNFVPGGNGEALAALTGWLAGADSGFSLHLWGEGASGKTHLLLASDFEYIDASLQPSLLPLHEREAAPYALAIDNVEALDGEGQIALFNHFNRARHAGGRLLTAAPQPPRHLALREDLRTRLGSGLICRLHALSDDEKLAALSTQAGERAMKLPPEWLTYLLRQAPRDMRTLSAVIVALDRYSLEHKRAITLPLLREVLQESHL